ncbi:hypothetical protein MTBBW1_300104 [Desulfamplus magnetovallimortis]|uniref:Uncharacterized protein n=1 Tax=Desulfamplus magnetovallimortis TaxID=1246637 RepID=A0A1W1HG31_9BACT|nr:hypothetical protein [Desulfamplus magnetovallimortis]SLM31373.1 hypothetical protein MTBBW1_300104 [Desulfamplus magnetovallimortis]
MRYLLVILIFFTLNILYLVDQVRSEQENRLFLVKIISINKKNNTMLLEQLRSINRNEENNDKEDNDKEDNSGKKENKAKEGEKFSDNIDQLPLLIYSCDNIPGNLEGGEIIRIWGYIDNDYYQSAKDNNGDAATLQLHDISGAFYANTKNIDLLHGKITGASYGNTPDPTGVRRRLQGRPGSSSMFRGGGMRGKP